MRFAQPPTLLSLLFSILSSTHSAYSRPNSRDRELLESQYHYLSERTCGGTSCGWTGQLCCTSGQSCSTNSAGQAVCLDSASSETENAENGQWQYYTTTYVETDLVTRTSTYSSFLGSQSTTTAAVPVSTGISCDNSLNESPCGTICCAVGQYCAYAGQCAASNGNSDLSSSYFNSVTSVATTTATNTAFIRPTSNVATTVTSTGSATTTVPFMTPSASTSGASSAAGMTATSSNNGLSGGAIAGIVIGVLAGIFLLLLLCAFFCFKGLWDALLGFFGLRNRRRRVEETTYIEERHSHRASGGGGGRTWYGAARPNRPPPKKSSGVGGLTGVAAALTALAILLGLKRRRDRIKQQKSEYGSEVSGSYSYSYSSRSSESSRSDDRRTRDTRRSRR